MNAPSADPTPAAEATLPWTCPFCSLLCDGFALARGDALELGGSSCPKARKGLALQPMDATAVSALIGDRRVSLDEALDAAAACIAGATLPLFGGLATDVAGMRAVYALASARGAILDHVLGDAIMNSVRPLQDRGVYYTTLAEVRTRADLILCVGTAPGEHYPEFFRRIAPGEPRRRDVVFLGTGLDASSAIGPDVAVEAAPLAGDLFDTLALINALCADKHLAEPPPGPLAGLAARLRAARYAVIVWEPGATGAHGALIGEAINRLVGTLNTRTRAASLALGGSQGGYTANQVVTWLSGLPLRTGLLRDGLHHEPFRFSTERLLRDGAVDLLLWVASFDPSATPPATDLPTVVIGHPKLAEAHDGGAAATASASKATGAARTPGSSEAAGASAAPPRVFIPVSTPGIGSAGHLFRLDGGVVVPLVRVFDDGLPTVASVARALAQRLAAIVPTESGAPT